MVTEALENYYKQNNLLMGRGVSLAEVRMLHMLLLACYSRIIYCW